MNMRQAGELGSQQVVNKEKFEAESRAAHEEREKKGHGDSFEDQQLASMPAIDNLLMSGWWFVQTSPENPVGIQVWCGGCGSVN